MSHTLIRNATLIGIGSAAKRENIAFVMQGGKTVVNRLQGAQ